MKPAACSDVSMGYRPRTMDGSYCGPWTARPGFRSGPAPGSMVDAFIVFYSLWPKAVQLDALPMTYEL